MQLLSFPKQAITSRGTTIAHKQHYSNLLVCAFILLLGLGFALVLPRLANSQILAAEEKPNESQDISEFGNTAPLTNTLAAEGIDYAPIHPDLCFATYNDDLPGFSTPDASAVQQAVDAASSGDTVKVAGTCVGVQTRNDLTQTVYISKSLTLEGGHTQSDWTLEPDLDSYTTTLNANYAGRVIVISGTQNVTLDSLFLMGGQAEDGSLFNLGGGIWTNSVLTLTNSFIISNSAQSGGGMCNWGVNTVLNDMTFSGNSASIFGGAMLNLALFADSSPVMTDVTFSGNSAGYGGAIVNHGDYWESSPKLTNINFSGNSAINDGGAMYNFVYDGDSSPILTNVTFSGNSADGIGGAMYNFVFNMGTCSPQIRNSILWNNKDKSGTSTISATIFLTGSATTTLTHSLVQSSMPGGSWIGGSYVDGGGNIDTDPMFIEPINPSTAHTTTGNLRLQKGSPAIDTGENVYIMGFPTDLDGKERIVDGNLDGTPTVDMGAYEYQIEYLHDEYIPLIFR
jgi:hypothetical protein